MEKRMIFKICTLLLPLMFLFNQLCAASGAGKNKSVSHTYKKKLDIRVMGVRRYYLLHVPASYSRQKTSPLIIVLHGAFSTPKQIEEQSGFSKLSDKEGFLVAYPSGSFGLFGFLKHWNAGFCCGKAAKDNIDDTGFLLKIIDDIKAEYAVDSSRVYMAGFSNGGMLTYLFAAEHTDKLAAAACLGASLGGRASKDMPVWKIPGPQSPLPMIVFHSRDDLNVPYNGGVSAKKGGEREYISVADSVDFWVKNNGCDSEPLVENLYDKRIVRKKWLDHQHGNDVVLYTIENWGHKWPGKYFTDKLDNNDPLKGFDAAEIIWDFFQRKKK